MPRRLPGRRWRTLVHNTRTGESVEQRFDGPEGVEFDELVIDSWFHLEQMDTFCWWLGVGGDSPEAPYLHLNFGISPARTLSWVTVEDENGTMFARWTAAAGLEVLQGAPS